MIVVSVFMITGINVNNPINSDELRMIVKRFRIIFLMVMSKKILKKFRSVKWVIQIVRIDMNKI